MTIDKTQIIELLRNQGEQQQHAGLLEKLGIDPQALLSQFMSGKRLPGF